MSRRVLKIGLEHRGEWKSPYSREDYELAGLPGWLADRGGPREGSCFKCGKLIGEYQSYWFNEADQMSCADCLPGGWKEGWYSYSDG